MSKHHASKTIAALVPMLERLERLSPAKLEALMILAR